MTPEEEAHRLELLRVLKNSPEDIEANRAGRLGPGQMRRLRRSAANALLVMIGVVVVFVAIIVFVAARPISGLRWALTVLVILAGLAAGAYQSAQLRRALREGTVESLTGPVRVTMRGRSGWWLTVAHRSFHLPVRFWHVGQDLRYRVYVAAAAQLIVAMEPDALPTPTLLPTSASVQTAELHPARSGQRTRLVARDLRVTYIMVDRLQADAEPAMLRIYFDGRGVRFVTDLDTASVLSGDRAAEVPFVQFLELALDGPGPWPWRVSAGDTRILSPIHDYTFSCRRETPEQYRTRTGALTAPPPSARPVRRFQIRADFAEHDERLSGSVTFVVERDTTPTPDETAELAYPAIKQETTRRLGEGDWRPALSGLQVRELLD